MNKPLTPRQRAMLIASDPDDRTGEEGTGVELRTGADYAVAKALKRRGFGYVTGPGGPGPGMYFNNEYGLDERDALVDDQEDGDCCPGCGACPGFTGVDCDETCEWATTGPGRP
jgi:hypothetical protein